MSTKSNNGLSCAAAAGLSPEMDATAADEGSPRRPRGRRSMELEWAEFTSYRGSSAWCEGAS